MSADPAYRYPAAITAYSLRGLLVCATAGCGRRLEPLQLAGQPRTYHSPCGCRLDPVDAVTVERRVHEVVVGHRDLSGDAVLGSDLRTLLYRELLTEVAVGVDAGELTFTWRTPTHPDHVQEGGGDQEQQQ